MFEIIFCCVFAFGMLYAISCIWDVIVIQIMLINMFNPTTLGEFVIIMIASSLLSWLLRSLWSYLTEKKEQVDVDKTTVTHTSRSFQEGPVDYGPRIRRTTYGYSFAPQRPMWHE